MRGETSMAATTLVALFSTRPSAARQLQSCNCQFNRRSAITAIGSRNRSSGDRRASSCEIDENYHSPSSANVHGFSDSPFDLPGKPVKRFAQRLTNYDREYFLLGRQYQQHVIEGQITAAANTIDHLFHRQLRPDGPHEGVPRSILALLRLHPSKRNTRWTKLGFRAEGFHRVEERIQRTCGQRRL